MPDLLLLTEEPLDVAACYDFLRDPHCGGIATFVGTVRDLNLGKNVTGLSFEAYVPMAEAELRKIMAQARVEWAVHKLVVVHGLGHRGLGEEVVFTGASSVHRDAAFAAARYLIDTLKERVPIWKKELYADGSHWINAHP